MKRILSACFLLFSVASFSQLTVQTGSTATQLGNILAGSNITVQNATVNGAAASFGTFTYTGTGFPMSSGVILSSGMISDAPGPNSNQGTTSAMGTPGNSLLTTLAGVQTYDAVEFQFDFEVQSDKIEFKYIFASEEYNEFVGSSFNDVFAFYISGPGITGWKNIALIPNTNVAVAINNVNNGSYWQYYTDNTTGTATEYDGFTTTLKAECDSLLPCNIYTLKLVIADAGDQAYDSGVFLEANSLIQNTIDVSSITFSGNNTALEGCIDASFTFSIDSIRSTPVVIPYTITGSALNGVDYVQIDTAVTIQPGQLSATIIIDALSDGFTEGQESIMIIYSPGPCTTKDTALMFIDDYQTLQFQTSPTNLSCNGNNSGQINVAITGGTAPFTVILTDTTTLVSNSYTTLPITGLAAATYSVQVLDAYGCTAQDVVIGSQYNGGAIFIPDGNQGQSYVNTLPISGFQSGQTLQNISQFQNVCFVMEHSFAGSIEIFLTAPNGTQIELKPQPGGATCDFGEPVATGPNDVGGSSNLTPGNGFQYCFTPTPTYGTMVQEANNYTHSYIDNSGNSLQDKYLPAGSYTSHDPLSNLIGTPLNGNWTLTITDQIPNNNGYVFSWGISLNADLPDSIVTLTQPALPAFSYNTTKPNCGASNGAIDITVSGSGSPFTYNWSTGATTQDITNVAAGNYSVAVTTSTSCTYTFNTSLSSNSTMSLSAVVSPQSCPSTSTGSVNLTPTGGTGTLTYSWSNGATTQDINNVAPGTYSVTVTDINGCVGAAIYTVSAATPVTVGGTVVDENCGDMEGTIDITPVGGTSPYTYAWSNGAITQDLQNLAQGTYSVTITDAKGCPKVATYTVLNLVGNCIPNCNLAINNSVLNNETCGSNNGNISLSVYTTHSPFTTSWSNGATSTTITGLAAGIYTVTLNDAEGCEIIQTYTVINQTSGVAISSVNTANENCGNGNGSINITTSGGSQPYTYSWSNGATTEDILSLSAGNYTVTATDASGCSVTQTYTVGNNAGTLAQTYGNAMDETCGNGSGSIDITITGGNTPYTYVWSNGASTQDLLNLSTGTYSCVITDQSGCQISTPTYTVNNQSGGFSIFNTDVDNEVCSNNAGSINLILTGGSSPYTYAWSTGATTSAISGLSAGNYSCVVTDGSGCSVNTGVLTVINDPGTLALNNVNSVDEICGNGSGSISINLTGGTTPYYIQWSNGATTATIINLSSGTYSCQVTDAQGCVTGTSAFVSNNAGTLAINNLVVTNETCGDQTGAVSVLTGGGTTPLTYSWSNGATTQNLSNINAGNFSVTVTDANGCTANGNCTVLNNSGTLAASISSQNSPLCGNSNGAINISVSGGTSPYTFAWSNGATSEDISGLAPGTYSCNVTDQSGCIVIIGPVTLSNSSGSLSVSNAVVTDETCNNNLGSINLTVSGGNTPYTYSWSTGATTQNINNLTSGVYTVAVTDGSGCSTTGSYTVNNLPGTLTISNAAVTDEICNNNSGSINLNVSGATGPYTYAWSNGATTQNLSGLNSGNYSVTVTSSNGCVTTGGIYTINNNPGNFSLSSILTTDATCGDSTGAINVTLSGGQSPVTYTWSNGINTEDITGIPAGVYTLSTTDNNGCLQVISVTVGNDPGNLSVANNTITSTTCGGANGAANITVSGGSTPYTFVWSNGATTEDISGVSAGTYSVYVTDASGCGTTHAVAIGGSGGNPVVTGVSVVDEVCNNNSGCITVNVGGGTAPYTYSWSAPNCCQYSLNMQGSGGAWFTAKVKVDINGVQYGLFNNTGGFGGTTVQIPVCQGDQIQLTWQPGGTTNKWFYLYDGSGIQVFYSGVNPPAGVVFTGTATCGSGGNGATQCNLSAGTYSVTITDANGCSTTASAVVNNSSGSTSIASANVVDELCGNGQGSVSITVSGSVTNYSWSNGGNTASITSLNSGVYTVTVTPTSGCLIVQSYTVNNANNNLTSLSTSTPADCGGNNGSASVTAFGGAQPYTYAWSSGGTAATETGLAAGWYTITVTDNAGCSYTDSVQVAAAPNTLATTLQNITNDSCGGNTGAISVSVSGGNGNYSYSWSNGATTQNISGISGGVYSLLVTDSLGCTLSTSYTVTNSAPYSVGMSASNATCLSATGSASVSVIGTSGPYTYLWNNAVTTNVNSGITPGWYSVLITDTAGCKQTDSVQVGSSAGTLAISGSSVSPDTCGNAWGQASVTYSGNTGNVTYNWSNGDTGASADSLAAGVYTVTITDSIGCTATDTYTVTNVLPNFSVQSFTVTNASCGTCATGAVNITMNWNGPMPSGATFSWSNGATSEDISGVLPGVYTVTVSDGNGCSIVQTYTVTSPNAIQTFEATEVKVYPNPSKGVFNVNFVMSHIGIAKFKVFNAIGQVVFEQLVEGVNRGEISINLGDTADGVYYLEFSNGTERKVMRLMKTF